ncbi:MAG TPA: DUF1028 domain-containing protein [Alphaproteobacteria bacterium]
MTWSIVAFDPASQAFAVAVTTRAFAVGARCPHVRSGVGAVSTQSISNPYLGPLVLDQLERGSSPAEAIEAALRNDAGRDLRQVHAVDRQGRAAAWTGRHCVEWAGHRTAPGFSVAGNMLKGETVVGATFQAFGANGDVSLAERLLMALDAGEAAGGDRRGRQSAALLLTTTEDFPDINLRVDDHAEPLTELRRLLEIYRRDLEPGRHRSPTKANPSGVTDLDAFEAAWRARGLDLRFRR